MAPNGTPPVVSDDHRRDRLPCGVAVDELFDQVASGDPPRDPLHQRDCAHCRPVLTDLRELWAPVHDLAAEEVRAPSDLVNAIMARIRELSDVPWYATVPDGGADVRIAARVIGAVARLAARSVPQVSLALGRGRAVPPDPSTEHAGPTDLGAVAAPIIVDIDIAVDYGASMPLVAEQARQHVIRDLRRHTGVTVSAVNVTVVDVRRRQ
jgi:uncharacterized alkaline shock family protein YloU